jgi:TPR repeat protein
MSSTEDLIIDFKEPSCMVCMDEFASARNKPIVILSCGHRIHFMCVNNLITKICPICRADITLEDEKSADEIFDIALKYYLGTSDLQQNDCKAFELFIKARLKGCMAAITYIGMCHLYGHGVTQDKRFAVKVFTEGHQKGRVTSTVHLARCYAKGEGVVKDERKAVEFYTDAHLKGNQNATIYLGTCYAKGEGVVKDERKAVELYTDAHLKGNQEATLHLGICYENGVQVWLKMSVKQLSYILRLI